MAISQFTLCGDTRKDRSPSTPVLLSVNQRDLKLVRLSIAVP